MSVEGEMSLVEAEHGGKVIQKEELPSSSSSILNGQATDLEKESPSAFTNGREMPEDVANKEPKDLENGQLPLEHPSKEKLEGPTTPRGDQNDDSPKVSGWREAALVFIMCLAQIMLQASLSQSLIPLLSIDSTFGVTDPGQESWPTAAFSLTVGTFILPAGRLGDMYGHKVVSCPRFSQSYQLTSYRLCSSLACFGILFGLSSQVPAPTQT